MTIRGLFPRLSHEHGEEAIHKFFTPHAVVEGWRMTYDPKLGTVTTEADESIAELDELDLDMVVKDMENTANFGERQVFVKERGDDDSVSTFQSEQPKSRLLRTKRRRLPSLLPQNLQDHQPNPPHLLPQVCQFTTKMSVNNKLTAFDKELKAFQSEVNSKVDLIIKSLNIQTTGQVVTPTKNNTSTPVKHNTTPNTSGDGTNGHNSTAQVSEDQNGSSETS